MATSTNTQAELNGVLIGDGTNFPIVNVEKEQPLKSHDLDRLLADGEFQGPQFAGPIYITFTLNIIGTTLATLFANRTTLENAWVASSTDLDLELNEPSVGARHLQGRVSMFKLPKHDASQEAAFRILGVVAQFKAGTPTWT